MHSSRSRIKLSFPDRAASAEQGADHCGYADAANLSSPKSSRGENTSLKEVLSECFRFRELGEVPDCFSRQAGVDIEADAVDAEAAQLVEHHLPRQQITDKLRRYSADESASFM